MSIVLQQDVQDQDIDAFLVCHGTRKPTSAALLVAGFFGCYLDFLRDVGWYQSTS